MDLRELTERAHRIRKLTETPDWQVLVEYVQTRVEAEQRWLMSGHAKTVEDYRGKAGWVQGAMHVLEAPDRIEDELRNRREREGT